MSSDMLGYPPSHRKVDELQPEVCDTCGLLVGGAHLLRVDDGPLSGRTVCDVTDDCRRIHSQVPQSWLRDKQGHEDWHTDSRYYDTGAPSWWDPGGIDDTWGKG